MSPTIESSNAVLTSNFVFNHLLDECRLRRNLMPTVNLASIVTALGEQWPTSTEDSDAASWIAKGRRYFRTGLFKAITRYYEGFIVCDAYALDLAVTALSDSPAPYFYLTMLGGKPQAPFDVIQTFYVFIYHLYQRDKVEMIHRVETGLGDIAVETFNHVCSLLLESRRLNSQPTPSQPNQGTESVEDEPEGDYSNAILAFPLTFATPVSGSADAIPARTPITLEEVHARFPSANITTSPEGAADLAVILEFWEKAGLLPGPSATEAMESAPEA